MGLPGHGYRSTTINSDFISWAPGLPISEIVSRSYSEVAPVQVTQYGCPAEALGQRLEPLETLTSLETKAIATSADSQSRRGWSLFCMRGDPKVTKDVEQMYKTIIRIRDKISFGVPTIATVNELEKIPTLPDVVSSMENWWKNNPDELHFSGHVCITTLPDDRYPSIPDQDPCQRRVRELFMDYSWKLVNAGPRDPRKKTTNTILSGETSVGKSSVINLISGRKVAGVSSGVVDCTMAPTPYDLTLDSTGRRPTSTTSRTVY
ncbi:hypothetical protein BDN67DRAFT_974211 [Paxillus ammoniavirescens]|nr:hypothetical protein BDN67DRAFT_974211 [Paxillus ammoniavirescens]